MADATPTVFQARKKSPAQIEAEKKKYLSNHGDTEPESIEKKRATLSLRSARINAAIKRVREFQSGPQHAELTPYHKTSIDIMLHNLEAMLALVEVGCLNVDVNTLRESEMVVGPDGKRKKVTHRLSTCGFLQLIAHDMEMMMDHLKIGGDDLPEPAIPPIAINPASIGRKK